MFGWKRKQLLKMEPNIESFYFNNSDFHLPNNNQIMQGRAYEENLYYLS